MTGTEFSLGNGDGRRLRAGGEGFGAGSASCWRSTGRPAGPGGVAASNDTLVRVHGGRTPPQKPTQGHERDRRTEHEAAVAHACVLSEQNIVEFEGRPTPD